MRIWPALLLAFAAPLSAQEVSENVTIADDGARTLTHELVVPASPEDVWQAVATAEGWAEWAVPVARQIEGTARFETAYDPEAAPGSPDTIEHEWLAREAPHRVVYRTVRTPAGFPHAETYLHVVSTFELTAAALGSTHVRLITSPYPANEAGDALLGFFRHGNAETLKLLLAHFTANGEADQSSLPATP